MTAGLVSIVIAEQRICRHVFYCTMKLDGEPRPGSREGGRETGTVIKRTRVLNVSLNVSQIDAEPRQRFRTLAGAVISNANKSFVSGESGNCIEQLQPSDGYVLQIYSRQLQYSSTFDSANRAICNQLETINNFARINVT